MFNKCSAKFQQMFSKFSTIILGGGLLRGAEGDDHGEVSANEERVQRGAHRQLQRNRPKTSDHRKRNVGN